MEENVLMQREDPSPGGWVAVLLISAIILIAGGHPFGIPGLASGLLGR